jgi:uncharacterized membrane protein YhhN
MTMPFAGGIYANANATLVFSLVAAVIYAFTLGMPPTLARSAAKTLAVGMLAVLAALQGGPSLLVAALALSAIGDALLSREGETALVGGIASVVVAHMVYIALFLRIGGGLGVLGADPSRAAIALTLAVFTVAVLAALIRRIGRTLRIPVAVSGLAALATLICALTTSNPLIIGGAVSLVVSDALFGIETFTIAAVSAHRGWVRLAVWILYYAAQLAITLGFLLS